MITIATMRGGGQTDGCVGVRVMDVRWFLLMTREWRMSGAIDVNMSVMSTPKALLVHVQGESDGMYATLPLAMLESVLTFV